MDLIILSDSFGIFMETESGIKKLEGFSKLDFNSGAQSYIRQYFSAHNRQTDITGGVPEISYTFDRMKNNVVHDCLAEISDLGSCGRDAVKNFILVDFSKEDEGKYFAVKQSFTVKCTDKRPESGFLDYSGKLIARGTLKRGHLVLNQDSDGAEFVPERSGILCD